MNDKEYTEFLEWLGDRYASWRPDWSSIRLWEEWKELDEDIIDDGFGTSASVYCPECGEKSMFICRPGDIRCSNCD